MAEGDQFYRLKLVEYRGRDAPILLQDENGPCPLIAIANVLSLRRQIALPSGPGRIAQSRVIQLIAGRLLDVGAQADASGASEAFKANMAANLADAIEHLPKLRTGVDVNVRFNSVKGFEFTDEIAVFDLLGVELVHGWLFDPGDAEVARVVGGASYNELVLRIIEAGGGASGVDGGDDATPSAPGADVAAAPAALAGPSPPLTPLTTSTSPAAGPQLQASPRSPGGEPHAPRTSPRPSPSQAPPSAWRTGSFEAAASTTDSLAPTVSALLSEIVKGALSSPAPRSEADEAGRESETGEVGEAGEEGTGTGAGAEAAGSGADDDGNGITTEATRDADAGPSPRSSLLGPSSRRQITSLTSASGRAIAAEGAALLSSRGGGGIRRSSAGDAPGGQTPSTGVATPDLAASPRDSSAPTGGGAAAATSPTTKALVVREFLESTASQLTDYGLESLREGLQAGSLAVLFRNNHFHVILRREEADELFVLVTDAGYAAEPGVVWQRLASVSGNKDELVDGRFARPRTLAAEAATTTGAGAGGGSGPRGSDLAPGADGAPFSSASPADVDRDAELAWRLAAAETDTRGDEELARILAGDIDQSAPVHRSDSDLARALAAEMERGSAGARATPDATAASAGADPAPPPAGATPSPPGTTHETDLALAMELQREEEEARDRRVARQRAAQAAVARQQRQPASGAPEQGPRAGQAQPEAAPPAVASPRARHSPRSASGRRATGDAQEAGPSRHRRRDPAAPGRAKEESSCVVC